MDSVQTLDAGRRSAYDPDEIDEEQKERDVRNKVERCVPTSPHTPGCMAVAAVLATLQQVSTAKLHADTL
jgi:hypothetical protein